MIEEAVEKLLREKIGLESRSVSRKALDRVLRERMRECGLVQEHEYLCRLTSGTEEMECLIDSLVVPETWFFRDVEPFVFLKKYVSESTRLRGAHHPLRILSVPSSTGEEPYSIAMALLDAGLKPDQFSIDAMDVSRKALQVAARAVYTPHSFREKDEACRARYFRRVDDGYLLNPEVCGAVHFIHGNLLDRASLAAAVRGPYNVIFFRNLLIYLDERARKEAVSIIDGLLGEDGVLFLGYAESPRVFFPRYVPVNHPRSYAMRKPKAADADAPASAGMEKASCPFPRVRAPAVSRRKAEPVEAGPGKPKQVRKRPGPEESVPPNTGTGPSHAEQESALVRANRLANQGELLMAAELCAECLKAEPTSVDAYFLLGIIAIAGGDEEQAMQNFQKVVYLEPSHAEALIHLSLLMEKRGHHDQAERYRERLLRVGDRSA